MPMLSNFSENELLDALLGTGSYVTATPFLSLHTAEPGETGANEVAGGSYARQSITFAVAASGAAANSSAESFTGMPAVTITHAGLWDASTVGNFLAELPIIATALRGFASLLATADSFVSPAHGLVDTNRVQFRASIPGTLPTGLSETTLYFVVTAATDTFQVSLTSGGAAVNFSGDGDVIWIKLEPRVVNLGDTVSFATSSLVLRFD